MVYYQFKVHRTEIFEYLKENYKNTLCNASNYKSCRDAKGLIPGHAYSVEGFEIIKTSKLIRLRNPWGEGEWEGKWSDAWIGTHMRDFSTDQIRKLKYVARSEEGLRQNDDGSFWMDWEDFVAEFENLTVCHLPDPNDYESRARGIFRYSNLEFTQKLQLLVINGSTGFDWL